MIPKSRLWKVRFYDGKRLLYSTTIHAPNREFARYNGARKSRNVVGSMFAGWDKVTVSPVKIHSYTVENCEHRYARTDGKARTCTFCNKRFPSVAEWQFASEQACKANL